MPAAACAYAFVILASPIMISAITFAILAFAFIDLAFAIMISANAIVILAMPAAGYANAFADCTYFKTTNP
ncbi:hypothetical protein PQG02_26835 [Nostoc sp. UHCC 0926]|uniref:hypothetical protein n=1 Tax=unclassified Nostoc TaxID=2593658 RepID=UPI00235E9E49|nr:hypothetical protein [Nostoc sp. UHCC 0926]WDD32240.1 hypothetical protein PQG02_26835 [Nostoc sp. UHCC 0926]